MRVLAGNPHLSALSPGELDALSFAFVETRCGDGHELVRLGEPGQNVYLIVSGTVDVVVPAEDGGEAVIATLSSGTLFGLLALLDGAPSSATCRARGAVVVATLSRHRFKRLEALHSSIGYAFRRALGGQLAADFRRLVSQTGARAAVGAS